MLSLTNLDIRIARPFQNLLKSMSLKLQAVIENKGDHAKHVNLLHKWVLIFGKQHI